MATVSENLWNDIHPVTVHLRTPTEFGRTITFLPRTLVLWMSHPAVQELRLAAG